MEERTWQIGDIAYWCENNGNGRYSVEFGRISDLYPGTACIDFLEPKERRLIDGVPFDEWDPDQRFRKLPKGWTYNTQLFKITYGDIDYAEEIQVKDPGSIQKAYEAGALVESSKIYHGEIEAEITKEGYRIVKRWHYWNKVRENTTEMTHKLRKTWEEAEDEVNQNVAEFNRQAGLSEYDWSVEQIDKTLHRYKMLSGATDDEIREIRAGILAMDKVDEIETRIFNGYPQWKYWKNKQWHYCGGTRG